MRQGGNIPVPVVYIWRRFTGTDLSTTQCLVYNSEKKNRLLYGYIRECNIKSRSILVQFLLWCIERASESLPIPQTIICRKTVLLHRRISVDRRISQPGSNQFLPYIYLHLKRYVLVHSCFERKLDFDLSSIEKLTIILVIFE